MKSQNSKLVVLGSAVLSATLILGAFLAVWLSAREPASASAQNANEATKPSQITVVGLGSINTTPDILKMTVGVAIQADTVLAAQTDVTGAIAAIEAKLKEAGIDAKDYRTVQYTVEPVMDFDGTKGGQGKLSGFRVTNMLEITFRDTARVAEILDSLVKAGANTIYGTSFAVSNPDALSQQAYEAAIKDAQARAEKIASLSGMTLGKIVSVSEATSGVYPLDVKQGMGGGGGFVPGQQTINTSLVVTYEAAPAK
jgi:uncharacterized protein